VSDFKIRPLHRRRKGRRKRVLVLNQNELAELLKVSLTELPTTLNDLGWRYHRDSVGALWATPPDPGKQPEGR
jgi:hypothetical protein